MCVIHVVFCTIVGVRYVNTYSRTQLYFFFNIQEFTTTTCFGPICGGGVYRVLVGKPEGKRPLGRPRRRRANNIRMDLQEVGCGYMNWIGLAQDRDRWQMLVSAVMNLRVL